jgi:HTH-type transcriptional regulator/antitoxin HipB
MTVNKRQYLPTVWGQTVRDHRKAAGLSQAELARLAGVGKTAVFDIEKGKATVRLATLLRVFDTLNLYLELRSPAMKGDRA